jgi:hypothetical protein
MLVQEVYLNATERHRFGESGLYEPFTEDTGKLFRAYRSEFGRCVSKVYIDRKEGPPIAVGWVFIKRERYEDTREPYLREVWVTLYDEPPTVTRENYYHAIGSHP